MLVSFKKLALAVVEDETTHNYTRLATGETEISSLSVDDLRINMEDYDKVNTNMENPYGGGTYIIVSLSQIRRFFWSQIAVMIMIPVVFWVFGAAQLWTAMVYYLTQGAKWNVFMMPALFFMIAFLFTPQAINPTVRDIDHKWVNLRTGYSNLNGVSYLLRKRR